MPTHLNYGIGEREKEILFEVLPSLTAKQAAGESENLDELSARYTKAEMLEEFKTKQLARIVSLRNANAKGIAYENRKRIIAEFSTPVNPEDTGRPEVQGMCSPSCRAAKTEFRYAAALLTYQIRNLWSHLQKFKRDVVNRRGLTKLVHQRAKILKYLKRADRDRYDIVLKRLGLEPEAVEGELVVV
jgi:small subunit ribosomal protein S15